MTNQDGVQDIRDALGEASAAGLLWEVEAPHGSQGFYKLSLWADRKTMLFSAQDKNPEKVARLARAYMGEGE